MKVDFQYERINLRNVPLKWVKTWNLMSYPHHDESKKQRIASVLRELGENDFILFMNRFLVSYIEDSDISKLDKIYNFLLSTLGD